MPNRVRALAGCLILLSIAPLEAANPAAEDHSLEVLESGLAAVEVAGRSRPLPYSKTLVGPMFALQPLVGLLGGELEIGPMQQKHQLQIGDARFLFGPGALAFTEDKEIHLLSQAPAAGVGGLHVPLDFLQALYGNLLGYDFEWQPTVRTLEANRRPLRELPVTVDVVNLRGVTTLVFEFAERPRYHIEKTSRQVKVEIIGDRLRPKTPATFRPDEFVQGVRMTPQSIRIDLGPQAAAQDYVLENPFRIVFDVLRERAPASVARAARPRSPSRRRGVRTVILDPGHGGGDPGARGSDGQLEKDLTLQLARQLKSRLERALNVRVVLTRGGDTSLSLDSRSALANQYKGDLFISLHINSSPNTSARGAETYFSSFEASDGEALRFAEAENSSGGDPLYDLQLMLWDLAQSQYLDQSQRLAGLVQAELNEALSLKNRGVKQAPFRVLLGAAMPAVLVELGFLSNPSEKRNLQSAEYRSELSEALVRAVSRYKASIESTPNSPEFSSR